ncbi:MAG: hypothetical protein ACJASX_000821 [Limisphaerales bacterium]|jgi:hypothetical protein
MQLEDIEAWLARRIRSESRNQLGFSILGGASGVALTLLTTALGAATITLGVHQFVEIGRAYWDWGFTFDSNPPNIALIALAFLALQLAGVSRRTGDYIFYLPHADWRSNESALQIIGALWAILLDIVYSGPRLVRFSYERWALRRDYRKLDQLLCARTLFVLHCRNKRVPFSELATLVPDFDEDESLPQLLLIRGTLRLPSAPPGLSLNSELQNEFGGPPSHARFDFAPCPPDPERHPTSSNSSTGTSPDGATGEPERSASDPSFRCSGCRRKFRLRNLRGGVVFKCPLCEQEYETVADMLGRVRVQLKSDYYDPTPDIELTGDLAGAYMKLGLPPGCTADEVKKAYRRLMKSFHPDKAANLGEPERIQFEERSKELNRAYSDIVKSQS